MHIMCLSQQSFSCFLLFSNQVVFDMTMYQNASAASSLSVNKYICLNTLRHMCPSQSKATFRED